jgi:hypothetical protein
MKGQMMRRLVTLCVVMLVTSHWAAYVAILLGADGDTVNQWLTLTDATFCTELLAMLLKKLLADKRVKNDAEKGE